MFTRIRRSGIRRSEAAARKTTTTRRSPVVPVAKRAGRPVQWTTRNNISAALEQARRYKTAVLVYFTSPASKADGSDLPRALRSDEIYNLSQSRSFIFCCVELVLGPDASRRDRARAEKYGVRVLPAAAIADCYGNVIYKAKDVNLKDPAALAKQLTGAKATFNELRLKLQAELERAVLQLDHTYGQALSNDVDQAGSLDAGVNDVIPALLEIVNTTYNGSTLRGYEAIDEARRRLDEFASQIELRTRRILLDGGLTASQKISRLERLKVLFPKHPSLRFVDSAINALRRHRDSDPAELFGAAFGEG